MATPRILGQFKPYIPNTQADKHWRHKAWSKKQEAVQRENRKVKAEIDSFEKEMKQMIERWSEGNEML